MGSLPITPQPACRHTSPPDIAMRSAYFWVGASTSTTSVSFGKVILNMVTFHFILFALSGFEFFRFNDDYRLFFVDLDADWRVLINWAAFFVKFVDTDDLHKGPGLFHA